MAETWVPDLSPESDFSLANIPFGIISTVADPVPRAATAIGSHVLDLKALASHPDFPKVFPGLKGHEAVFAQPTLNAFAALGRSIHREVRAGLQDLLSVSTSHPAFLKDNSELRGRALVSQSAVKMHLPMEIGDYTDFYAGYNHAYHVGCLFRNPANALQPNYTHLPVGYHGRASSVVVSRTPIQRPTGQILLDPAAEPKAPVTAPSRRLDFELEFGCFVSRPNAMGEAVTVGRAEEGHIFGYVLLNDWSARDIQAWEYVPLGPFNSKNFATSVSPWVVTPDAVEPFRVKPMENKTELQPYLRESRPDSVFDISLEVDITTPDGDTTTVTRTSTKNLIWSFPQMLAHHTLGGCPMRTGDLLGSGTISGTGAGEGGSMLELSDGGKRDVLLYGMDARRFLKDGDTVTFRGSAGGGSSGGRVGFGSCVGRVQSAPMMKW